MQDTAIFWNSLNCLPPIKPETDIRPTKIIRRQFVAQITLDCLHAIYKKGTIIKSSPQILRMPYSHAINQQGCFSSHSDSPQRNSPPQPPLSGRQHITHCSVKAQTTSVSEHAAAVPAAPCEEAARARAGWRKHVQEAWVPRSRIQYLQVPGGPPLR